MLSFNTPRITFFLRSNKDAARSYVLYCRVNMNSSTSEFSTGEKLNPDYWHQEKQEFLSPNKAQNKYITTLIETISYKLKSHALLSEVKSAKELVQALTPKKVEKTERIRLVKMIQNFILFEEKVKSPGTIKGYRTKLNNLIQFEKYTKRTFYISPQDQNENFDLPTAERFKSWFMKTRATGNITTASRAIEFYKKVLIYAVKKGLIRTFDLLVYSPERDSIKSPIYLDHSEYMKIFNATFDNPKLEKVRDLYLFQISTGLAYCDLWSWELKSTENGLFLYGNRGKTKQLYFVPLDEVSRTIIDKYNGNIPRYSNQPYNRGLKELADALKIRKRLTTHTGRKTFATFMDQQGWSMESIARMLGHSSINTTEKYYVGQTINRVELELQQRQKKRLV